MGDKEEMPGGIRTLLQQMKEEEDDDDCKNRTECEEC